MLRQLIDFQQAPANFGVWHGWNGELLLYQFTVIFQVGQDGFAIAQYQTQKFQYRNVCRRVKNHVRFDNNVSGTQKAIACSFGSCPCFAGIFDVGVTEFNGMSYPKQLIGFFDCRW